MVAYYSNKQEVIKALNKAKSREEVKKIMNDLEQRMAPSEWLNTAYEEYKGSVSEAGGV